MTERCNLNPCCGDHHDCKPPPQFEPSESYEEYEQRVAKVSVEPSQETEDDFLAWAYDTLREINPSNYDHDDVCGLNAASVEVILAVKARRAALAKPASEPAGGDVDEIERLTKERNEHANYAAEAIEQRAEMEAQLNSLIRAGGDLRAVSDNGKRWRIVPVDGDWEMVPVGHITARQAEALCKRIAAAALSSSAGPAEPVAWAMVGYQAQLARYGAFPMRSKKDETLGYTEPLYAHPAPATVEMREEIKAARKLIADGHPLRAWKRLDALIAALAPATEGGRDEGI